MAYSKDPKNYVVLTRCGCLIWTAVLVVCAAGAFLMWPWDPEVEIARLMVRRVKVHPLPPLSADVWLSVTVRVHNKGVYWMELKEVDVGVKYRGNKLGHVETEGWHVRGWGTSRVFGELEFSRLPSGDVAHLMQDLAKGRAHFRAVVEVTGHLGLLLFDFPSIFKIILSCEVLINTKNHSIVHQHCLHKD